MGITLRRQLNRKSIIIPFKIHIELDQGTAFAFLFYLANIIII